jgi:hypothetical protein
VSTGCFAVPAESIRDEAISTLSDQGSNRSGWASTATSAIGAGEALALRNFLTTSSFIVALGSWPGSEHSAAGTLTPEGLQPLQQCLSIHADPDAHKQPLVHFDSFD